MPARGSSKMLNFAISYVIWNKIPQDIKLDIDSILLYQFSA
jgi:hypothetical protein